MDSSGTSRLALSISEGGGEVALRILPIKRLQHSRATNLLTGLSWHWWLITCKLHSWRPPWMLRLEANPPSVQETEAAFILSLSHI